MRFRSIRILSALVAVSFVGRAAPPSPPLPDKPFPVDGVVFGAPTPTAERAPVLVAGQSGYLAVWTAVHDVTGRGPFQAVRLDGDGLPIGPPVTIPAEEADSRCAAFDGASYFIAWSQYQTQSNEYDVYLARLNASGVLVGEPTALVASGDSEDPVDLACADDGGCLLIWKRFDGLASTPSLFGTIVRADGSADRQVSLGNGPTAAAAWDGSEYLVAKALGIEGRSYTYRVETQSVSRDGSDPAPPVVIAPETESDGIDLASNGTGYAVSWRDSQPVQHYAAMASLFDARGVLLRHVVVDAPSSGLPRIVSNGLDYLTWWPQVDFSFGWSIRRLGPDGAFLDASPIRQPGVGEPASTSVQFASDGSAFMKIWSTAGNVYTEKLSDALASLRGPSLVTAGANTEFAPSVAARAGQYLVAWQDNRDPDAGTGVYAVRVDETGTVLDAPAFLVAPRADYPTVVAGSETFLVIWNDRDRGKHATRIAPSGEALDPSGLALPGTGGFAVAPAANGFLFAYVDGAGLWSAHLSAEGVIASKVSAPFRTAATVDGVVPVTSLIPVEPTTVAFEFHPREPAMASNGTSALLVACTAPEALGWVPLYAPTGQAVTSLVLPPSVAVAVRLSMDGIVLDSEPIPLPIGCAQTVVWQGDAFLVNGQAGAVRVYADGSVGKPFDTGAFAPTSVMTNGPAGAIGVTLEPESDLRLVRLSARPSLTTGGKLFTSTGLVAAPVSVAVAEQTALVVFAKANGPSAEGGHRVQALIADVHTLPLAPEAPERLPPDAGADGRPDREDSGITTDTDAGGRLDREDSLAGAPALAIQASGGCNCRVAGARSSTAGIPRLLAALWASLWLCRWARRRTEGRRVGRSSGVPGARGGRQPRG